MITYKDIYEAAKKERYSENLQPIPKNFVKEVSKYLKEKNEITSKEDDVFSDSLIKNKRQLENARTLFQELLRRRRKKIFSLVLIASDTGISKQDFENMLLVEKQLFEELVDCVEKSDKSLNQLINGEKEESIEKNSLVVFLEEVDEFVSASGQKFGPYSIGDFANIPKEVATILHEDSQVEFMDNQC